MCYVEENDVLINKISLPSTITLQKPYLFTPSINELPIVERVQSLDFLDIFDRNCINGEVDGINIIFISDLKDISFLHYMTHPRSMLYRKFERILIEGDYGKFNYNWLPNSFRHIL